MSERSQLGCDLPAESMPAQQVAMRLANAGFAALFAGGCVRDLLLGRLPSDYDVATDAPPDRVCALFRNTRRVGAQFGVVLVKNRGVWVEVATFRSDGDYADGRHPTQVHFSDARSDAERRDFTINGMFLDPTACEVIDYVGGREDLERRVIRAIGDPHQRFAEDHLRVVRAIRFAARLDFGIEAETLAAIRAQAPQLRKISAERIRDELEYMWRAPSRGAALRLLIDTGVVNHLCAGLRWTPEQAAAGLAVVEQLPAEAGFELVLAVMLSDRTEDEVHEVGRKLTCSNEQRETVAWLRGHQADLDQPASPSLADLKRLMAHPAFTSLRQWTAVRHAAMSDGSARAAELERRVNAIAAESIEPAPFIKGNDIAARGIKPGPIYSQLLDEFYTLQLDERITNRAEALAALDERLRQIDSAGE
jgi:poly(A) polymerase